MSETRFQLMLIWDILCAVWCWIKTRLHLPTRAYEFELAEVEVEEEQRMEYVFFPWQ